MHPEAAHRRTRRQTAARAPVLVAELSAAATRRRTAGAARHPRPAPTASATVLHFPLMAGRPPHEIRPVRPDEWRALRDLRLRALAADPQAFCSTHAAESALDDAEWQRRSRPDAATETTLVAEGPEGLEAMAGAYLEGDAAAVWGMWVAPEARRRGLAGALLDALAAWARRAGARRLTLVVLDGAPDAARAYRAHGFAPGVQDPAAPGETRLDRPL
ncbi:MAG TPA: GNAT family N-acetyltransferase [Baekduia sp.]|nr:GNAT family N-acetyltransferase [Baekduia sp.]